MKPEDACVFCAVEVYARHLDEHLIDGGRLEHQEAQVVCGMSAATVVMGLAIDFGRLCVRHRQMFEESRRLGAQVVMRQEVPS